MAQTLVSRKELAREWGVSDGYIRNLVSQGKLPVTPEDKIDLDVANAIRSTMSTSHMNGNQTTQEMGGQVSQQGEGKPSVAENITKVRAAEASMKAQLMKIKLERQKGELIETKEVEMEAVEVGTLLSQAIMAIPARLSAEMVACRTQAEAKEVLMRECRQINEEIVKRLGGIAASLSNA